MFNPQKYRDYVDEIHTPETLKRATLQRMRQNPERRRIHPLIPAAAMTCVCALLLAVVIPWSAGRPDGPEVSAPGTGLPLTTELSGFVPTPPPLGEGYQPEIRWDGGELLFKESSMEDYPREGEITDSGSSFSFSADLNWTPLPSRLPEDLFPAASGSGDTLLCRSADGQRIFSLTAGAQDTFDPKYLEEMSASGEQPLSRIGDMLLWLAHDGSGESEIFATEFVWYGVGCGAYSVGLSQREFLEALFSALPSDILSQGLAEGDLICTETDTLPFPNLEEGTAPLPSLSDSWDWRGCPYPMLMPAEGNFTSAPAIAATPDKQVLLFKWGDSEAEGGPRLLLAQTRQSGFADQITGLPVSSLCGFPVLEGRTADAPSTFYALFQVNDVYCILQGEGLGQQEFEIVLRSLLANTGRSQTENTVLPESIGQTESSGDSEGPIAVRINSLGPLDTRIPSFHLPDIDHVEELDYDAACKVLFGFDPAPVSLPEGFSLEKPEIVTLSYENGALLAGSSLACPNEITLRIRGKNEERAIVHIAPSQIPYWSVPRDEHFAQALLLSSQDPLGKLGAKSQVGGVSFTLWEGGNCESWDWYNGTGETVNVGSYFCADFTYRGAGFSVAAEGFSQEAFAGLLLDLTGSGGTDGYEFQFAEEDALSAVSSAPEVY